jgi:hypothetical protein
MRLRGRNRSRLYKILQKIAACASASLKKSIEPKRMESGGKANYPQLGYRYTANSYLTILFI